MLVYEQVKTKIMSHAYINYMDLEAQIFENRNQRGIETQRRCSTGAIALLFCVLLFYICYESAHVLNMYNMYLMISNQQSNLS